MSKEIADLLYPNNNSDLNRYLSPLQSTVQWPRTRFAPSPTGFLHIGWVNTGLVSNWFANQNNGTFILRIEDTDQARDTTDFNKKKWGIYWIIESLDQFTIYYNEWVFIDNWKIISKWNYWPYIQSHRLFLYHNFAKWLVEHDLAYPCFLDPQELESIKSQQTLIKAPTWIYWVYARDRDLWLKEIIHYLDQSKSFVLRIKNNCKQWTKFTFNDLVRWEITMDQFYDDYVLIKWDGFPVYHFAHFVDDLLMRISHVIRTDERLASTPKHFQIYETFSKRLPLPKIRNYAHISPLMKLDKGNKRKLSKRKDPEANVWRLLEQWYSSEAIKLYLCWLIHSWFEEWYKELPVDKRDWIIPYLDYPFDFKNCNISWAIVDIQKLNSLSADYLSMIPVSQLKKELQEFYSHTGQMSIALEENESYLESVLSFDRNKKLHVTYQDIVDYILPFFQDSLSISNDLFPSSISPDQRKEILNEYKNYITQELFDDQWVIQKTKEEWFDDLKWFGKRYHIAGNKKEFEMWWYIAQIGDLAMILRVLLYGKLQTPDIYEMIKIYGLQKTLKRLW